ncbi:MAG: hypothetical protein U0794_12685 [Isosphaeraceae bacterium]
MARRLGLVFPDGYTEYAAELGEGTLSNSLRVWMPAMVEKRLTEFRQLLLDCYSWKSGGTLRRDDMRRVVVLGDTLAGDTLVLHPEYPDEIFFLPRHDETIRRLGPGLDAAIAWLCDEGGLGTPTRLRYFEPGGKRARIVQTLRQPFDSVRERLLSLGIHTHIAWEEPVADDEPVFEVHVKRGRTLERIEGDERALMLLIREIGGSLMITADSLGGPRSTEIVLEHVVPSDHPVLVSIVKRLGLTQPDERPWWRRWF